MRRRPRTAGSYRPQDPRVPINGMWMRQLGEDEIAEWFRNLDRIYAARCGRPITQLPRIP